MPPPSSTLLTPKPPRLRDSESQAMSNASSFISSSSSSSLFDRVSGASSGYLTDLSSPFTPSAAEFGNEEGEVTQPSDSHTKEQSPLASRGQHDRALFSPQSRLPRPTSGVSPINRSSRLDRACILEFRPSSVPSYSRNGTPFLSLIPIAVPRDEDRRYYPDTFDAVAILKDRLERANPTVATSRALEIMDLGGRPPATGGAEAPVTVIVTGPDSPVEDWSDDFELGSAKDVKVCPESSSDIDTLIDQFSNSESDLDEDGLDALEIAAAHSSILFPSASDRSLFDAIEQDTLSSSESFRLGLPSKPILEPVASDSPCSTFILGTPELSSNWEDSCSSLSTLMAVSPPSLLVSSPANISFDEEEMARMMRTLLSFPTHMRQPLPGSDVDVATAMRLEIASTLRADNHSSQTRTLTGLGVAMPVIHPPLPPTLFPFHHPPAATLDSRSLQDLGYQSFDIKMFEIERTSLAILSRDVNRSGLPNVETSLSGLGFDIDESSLYSPLEGCIPVSAEVNLECSDAFKIEQAPPLAPLVGLGLGTLTSIESQPSPAELSTTTGRHTLVSVDEPVTEEELATPLPVSDLYPQVQNSLIFEPLGAQKNIELDASQLERQSALYILEHIDLPLDNIFCHSPPVRIEKRERQLLAGLFKKRSRKLSQSQPHIRNPSLSKPKQYYSDPCTLTTKRENFSRRSYQTLKKLGLEQLAIFQPRSSRNDLDLISPSVAPQDDPRSPCQSTMERAFLTFTINPSSEMPSPINMATTSNRSDIKQSFGSAFPMDKEVVTHLEPEDSDPSKTKKNMEIGLGLPSHLAFRRSRLQETSSQESSDTVRCQSKRYSQERQNPSLVVTEPSFVSSRTMIQSAESSNQFLKPSHFPQRPLYDIVEVPTPPSTSSCSPGRTPSPRNQWSSPFIRLNPPQKRQLVRSQCSTPSRGLPLTVSSDTKIEVPLPEVLMAPTATARTGFKRFVSKFTRVLFKRPRSSLKTSDLVLSPVVIEHADVPHGLGLFSQNSDGTSCGANASENGFMLPSVHKLELLF